MKTKYKYMGAIGTIVILIVLVTTLYPKDYRAILDQYPNATYILLDFKQNEKIEVLTKGISDYLRWKYDKDKFVLYSGRYIAAEEDWLVYYKRNWLSLDKVNNLSICSRITPTRCYVDNYYERLARKPSLIKLYYTNTTNSITIIKETPYYAYSYPSGSGGILIQKATITEKSTIYNFPENYEIQWIPSSQRQDNIHKLVWRIQHLEFIENSPKGYFNDTDSVNFGKNVKIVWKDAMDQFDFGYAFENESKMMIYFKPQIGNQTLNVRIFDPVITLYLDGLSQNRYYETGYQINATGISDSGDVCLSIYAKGYGANYTCGTNNVEVDWTAFTNQHMFNDSTELKQISANTTVYIEFHNESIVLQDAKWNFTGIPASGAKQFSIHAFNDSSSIKYLVWSGGNEGQNKTVWIKIPKEANVTNAVLDIYSKKLLNTTSSTANYDLGVQTYARYATSNGSHFVNIEKYGFGISYARFFYYDMSDGSYDGYWEPENCTAYSDGGYYCSRIDYDGNYYWIIDSAYREIQKYDSDANGRNFIGKCVYSGMTTNDPDGLVHADNGYIYIPNSDDGLFYKYDTNCNLIETIDMSDCVLGDGPLDITDHGSVFYLITGMWNDRKICIYDDYGETFIGLIDVPDTEVEEAFGIANQDNDLYIWINDNSLDPDFWRFNLNYVENPFMDATNDTDIEWSHSGEFTEGESPETTNSWHIEINDTLPNCDCSGCNLDADGNCHIPLVFGSDEVGYLKITNLDIDYKLGVPTDIDIDIGNDGIIDHRMRGWLYGNTLHHSELSDGSKTKNLTYNQVEAKTIYFNLPRKNMSYATFEVNGFRNPFNQTYESWNGLMCACYRSSFGHIGSYIYRIGGICINCPDKIKNGTFEYDPSTGEVTMKAQAPVDLGMDVNVVEYNGNIYVNGGYGNQESGNPNPVAAVYKYDRTTNTWTQVGNNNPKPVAGGNNVVIGDAWYIHGGINSSGDYVHWLMKYNFTTGTWTELSEDGFTGSWYGKFRGAAAQNKNDTFLVWGGIRKGGTYASPYTWEYNITSDTWNTSLGDQADLSRGGQGGIKIGNYIYSFGGFYQWGSTCYNDIYIWNDTSRAWEKINSTLAYASCLSDAEELDSGANIYQVYIPTSDFSYSYMYGSVGYFYPEDAYINIGDDADIEWSKTNALYQTEALSDFSSELNEYLTNECSQDICLVPIIVYSKGGIVEISQISIEYNPNPFELNTSKFTEYMQNNVIVPISINSSNWEGILKIHDLDFPYYGSQNVTIIAHTPNYDTNDTHYAYIVYSNFSLKIAYDLPYFEFFPDSNSSKNVTPYGQTDNMPIFNYTSLAYDKPMNISIYWNQTVCQPGGVVQNHTVFYDDAEDWTHNTNCPVDCPWDTCGADSDGTYYLQSISNGIQSAANGTYYIGVWDYDEDEDYLVKQLDLSDCDEAYVGFYASCGNELEDGEQGEVYIYNGTDLVEIYDCKDSGEDDENWHYHLIRISDYITLNDQFELRLNGKPTFTRDNHEWNHWDAIKVICQNTTVTTCYPNLTNQYNCTNITLSLTNSKNDGIRVEYFPKTFISNLDPYAYVEQWAWADLENCSGRWIETNLVWESCCTECVPCW